MLRHIWRISVTCVDMKTLEDSTVKDVWAYHFPKRNGSVAARLVLVTLIGIIKKRSGADNAQRTATANRFGIPTEEWNQFEAEL
jgi:hypothetical protein